MATLKRSCHRDRDHMAVGLQLPVQSVSITTKVVSLNPVHGDVYSIQHYVIAYVRGLRQVCRFLLVYVVSSTNKTDCHYITEILLKVVLKTIDQTNIIFMEIKSF
jgi:hypothetical protein